MTKVLTFGELLIRISPDVNGAWLKGNSLPAYAGGAEANVAVALARWGVPSAYLSAVPDHFLGRQMSAYIASIGVDVSRMRYTGDRLGTYYLSEGKDLKNTAVIYDRKASSFSTLAIGMIDWAEVFRDISWFHFSAICPAISADIAQLCEEALKVARQLGIIISLDLNYRNKLWKYGKDPLNVMPSLAKYCNLIMGNIWAAECMLGIMQSKSNLESDEDFIAQSLQSSAEIIRLFPACRTVANTFRFDSGKGIRYYSTMLTDEGFYLSDVYLEESVIGKVGSGDCFMAGLIYGFYHQHEGQAILNFATAAAVSKLFEYGDFTENTVADIELKALKRKDAV
ncbi:PfkB domain protein [Pedobacter sp. BAL39]|uniref:sugar kinase n=1 Tax=Pedobacter sp. BAL39 TaxID=391596 RepID=UPI000155AC7B|nr:sugar kinase [Pedobacter sp. BAL39]EDM33875.1 PfkB domain protein [Pedobacter sp. BAL39]